MTTESEHHKETPLERAERDPIGLQHDWLHATEEATGQETLERAIDAATGADPDAISEASKREAQERERAIRSQFG
jgi:hypothetical protein